MSVRAARASGAEQAGSLEYEPVDIARAVFDSLELHILSECVQAGLSDQQPLDYRIMALNLHEACLDSSGMQDKRTCRLLLLARSHISEDTTNVSAGRVDTSFSVFDMDDETAWQFNIMENKGEDTWSGLLPWIVRNKSSIYATVMAEVAYDKKSLGLAVEDEALEALSLAYYQQSTMS